MFFSRRISRISALAVVALVTASAASLAVPDVWAASTGAKPAAGVIHLYIVNTSIAGRAPGDALISGAFADHGTVSGATLRLKQGTITSNIAKLKALTNSPKFATGYAASCSFSGAGDVTLPIVSGTGAYTGISGTLAVRVTFGAQNPVKNGKCDGNALPLADQETITGSGKVSF